LVTLFKEAENDPTRNKKRQMHVTGPAEKNCVNLIYFVFGVNLQCYPGTVGI
jgi:hypothetical protein